jgi:hypothetical protein
VVPTAGLDVVEKRKKSLSNKIRQSKRKLESYRENQKNKKVMETQRVISSVSGICRIGLL